MVDISLQSVGELEKEHPTPFFVFDYTVLKQTVKELHSIYPDFKHSYSVKANSHDSILRFFKKERLYFDVAGIEEVQKLRSLSVPARAIFFNHPIKTGPAIKQAGQEGVQWFTVDSMEGMEKVFDNVKEPSFLIRLAASGRSALYPHTDKFGADQETAHRLIKKLYEVYKIPSSRIGLSFQVGTQVTDEEDWVAGLKACLWLIRKTNCVPGLIDIGGGIPVHYEKSMKQKRKEIADTLRSFVQSHFPKTTQFIIEPGRFMVAEAGMLVVSIIAIVKRQLGSWIFVDGGAYSGLLEAPFSHVVYPVMSRSKKRRRTYNIAGPLRDGEDIIRKQALLGEVQAGDHLYIQNCGAYSLSFLTHYQLKPYPPIYFVGHP